VPQDLLIDPFARSHDELDLPPHPLFVIDQLGVDRRMVSLHTPSLKGLTKNANVVAFPALPDGEQEKTAQDVPHLDAGQGAKAGSHGGGRTSTDMIRLSLLPYVTRLKLETMLYESVQYNLVSS
jgi:hypothetical protein